MEKQTKKEIETYLRDESLRLCLGGLRLLQRRSRLRAWLLLLLLLLLDQRRHLLLLLLLHLLLESLQRARKAFLQPHDKRLVVLRVRALERGRNARLLGSGSVAPAAARAFTAFPCAPAAAAATAAAGVCRRRGGRSRDCARHFRRCGRHRKNRA